MYSWARQVWNRNVNSLTYKYETYIYFDIILKDFKKEEIPVY